MDDGFIDLLKNKRIGSILLFATVCLLKKKKKNIYEIFWKIIYVIYLVGYIIIGYKEYL